MHEATLPAPNRLDPARAAAPFGALGTWREALLVSLGVGLWSLVERGYGGARWSDAPIIKSFVDPRLYRQDPFIWALHEGTPAAYAYQLIAIIVGALGALSLDQALFVLYAPASIAALALLYRIGLHLTRDRAATVLFLLLYVAGFRLTSIGSAILHAAELTPQTLALPFHLGSLYALLLGRLPLAGLLMGLAFNLHAPSSVYLATALGIALLLSTGRFGLRPVVLALGLVALAGAPTLLGSLLKHGDQLPLWALHLARAELATDISFTVNFATRPLVVYNLLGLGLIAIALRAAPRDDGRRLVLLLLLAVGLMCAGAMIFFDLWLRSPFSTLVARLQLPRGAWILNVFGLLYLALCLVRGWQTGGLPRPLVLLLIAAMLAAPPDFVPLDPLLVAAAVLTLVQPLLRTPVLQRWLTWAPWGLAVVGGLAGVAHLEVKEYDFELALRTGLIFAGLALGWRVSRPLERRGWAVTRAAVPALLLGLLVAGGLQQAERLRYAGAHRGGLQAARAFQDWAREQTPIDSVFLILPSEPNNNDFYEYADRAVYLVRERANQAVYFRSHNFEFERRVRALGIEQPLRYREALDPAFRRLTEAKVRELARDFGVTHFVPARAGNFSFPVVYQDGGWTVYEVSP